LKCICLEGLRERKTNLRHDCWRHGIDEIPPLHNLNVQRDRSRDAFSSSKSKIRYEIGKERDRQHKYNVSFLECLRNSVLEISYIFL
jgi:hypothetical protein